MMSIIGKSRQNSIMVNFIGLLLWDAININLQNIKGGIFLCIYLLHIPIAPKPMKIIYVVALMKLRKFHV